MLHRDISVNNVMYEYRDTRLYFILIDFDMATILTEDYSPSSKHRTGTLAFMAVDLIWDAALTGTENYQTIPHMLCHDFESVFWLCLWCTLVLVVVADRQHRRDLLKIARAWETKDLATIANAKFALCLRSLKSKQIILPPAAVEVRLDAWFLAWHNIWRAREAVVQDHSNKTEMATIFGGPLPLALDQETAGGVLTRENLRKELTSVVPDLDEHSGPLPASLVEAPSIPTFAVEGPPSNDAVNDRKIGVDTEVPRPTTLEEPITLLEDAPKSDVASMPNEATRNAGPPKGRKGKGKAAAKKATTKKAANVVKKTNKGSKVTKKKTRSVMKDPVENQTDDNDIRKRLRPRKR